MAIDFSKPVQTKEGKPVRILCTDGPGLYPVIGINRDNDCVTIWTLEGRFFSGEDSVYDLENVPEERTYYTVYFPSSMFDGIISVTYADDLDDADLDDALAIYKVTTVGGKITKMEGGPL